MNHLLCVVTLTMALFLNACNTPSAKVDTVITKDSTGNNASKASAQNLMKKCNGATQMP